MKPRSALRERPGLMATACFPPPVGGWRHAVGGAVTSDAFNACSTLLVVVNMALMCMAYDGMSEAYAAKLEGASFVDVDQSGEGRECVSEWVEFF